MITRTLLLSLLLAASSGATAPTCQQAAVAFDLKLASRALVEARSLDHREPRISTAETLVRCNLIVAELIRFQFEGTSTSDNQQRLSLGRRIDTAANEGLTVIDRLPETSERERLRADLTALMIRSSYRAKKYDTAFRSALERALTLDPDNPRALVTEAKPLIFAPAKHGGDPAAALPILDRALSLDSDLESALLLRGLARHLSNDDNGARADWLKALELNPLCTPALEQLEAIEPEVGSPG